MNIFLITLVAVAVLLLTAVPGFLLIRKKMVTESCIPGMSKVLLFVCQPCLATYSFLSSGYSLEKLKNVGIFALLILAIHAVMLTAAFLVLKRKSKEPIYRIMTIATTFGNCAFFGIPIIEAILPDLAPELIIYTTVYAVVMNVLGWTVGSAIISHDTKYITLRKVVLNPAMISTLVALTLYIVCGTTGFSLPESAPSLYGMITIVARMASPFSMIIMGMRLGTMRLSEVFTEWRVWATIAVKQFVMPLVAFAFAVLLTPLDLSMRQTFFILCGCPVASIVLNFSEILGEGQKEAADCVLVGTIASILTLPVVMFLFPLIH